MPNKLALSLAVMRLAVGTFFLVWALEKILAPEAAIRVAQTFCGITPDAALLAAIGAAQIALIAAFVLGLFKTVTYGALLLIHSASVATTWERLIDPYTLPNHLFWAAMPVVALLLALFLLREDDTWLTWRRQRHGPPGAG